MPKLTWIHSIETVKYDTPDGDLHENQYAFYKGVYHIRLHPENNHQPILIAPFDDRGNPKDVSKYLEGKTEVKVLDGQHMYYDFFLLPDERVYRVATTRAIYTGLAKVGALSRSKTVSLQTIADITKDDSYWNTKGINP